MLPTLRQLQYLKLLAQHGSFSRAADAAHVTQPTLSAGVQELEKILGAPVVDRARSGVILTPVGEEALRRGSEILAQAEDLLQAARSACQPLSGRFRLGVIPTIAPYLLPKVLRGVRTRYPNLKLFLREDRTQALIAALKAGALDAAIIALPYDTAGLQTASIGEDELLAALPANHALVGAGPLGDDWLSGQDLILLEDGHCLRDHALGACGLEAPKTSVGEDVFAATSLATLVQMVGAGLGVTFLPAMAVEAGLIDQVPISTRRLTAEKASREIVIAWRAGSSRGAEARLLAEVFRGV